MPFKPTSKDVKDQAWKLVGMFLGESPELVVTKDNLNQLRREIRNQQQQEQKQRQEMEAAMEQVRSERLEWQAKESSTRKDLYDCQERGKELLEQVVQLTHQQRQTKASLLDQKFKTEATPLERNRFAADLSEAQAKVKEAEQRARLAFERTKKAEAAVSRMRELEKQAAKVKGLQSQLAWEGKRAGMQKAALGGVVEKIRELESQLAQRPAAKAKAKAKGRPYRKPRIRLSKAAKI